jgi:PAS domain-containing protein
VRDEAGEPLHWQGFIFDITELKEAEEKLRASETELRVLFESMTDIILAIDGEGRLLKIAPTNPSLLYRLRGEVLGKTLAIHERQSRSGPAAIPADLAHDHAYRRTGGERRGEYGEQHPFARRV